MVAIPRFYASEVECEEFCDRLKLVVCPHCRRVGTLNRHGYLKGYPEGSGHLKEDKVIRGRRFFCNGRGRRPGCGRTFSLLACEFLFGFVMVALTVWRLLRAFAGGEAPRAAFQASGSRQSKRAAYHVLRRFRQRRARLRTLLLRRCAAPDRGDEQR